MSDRNFIPGLLSILDNGINDGRIEFKDISGKLHLVSECGCFVKNIIHSSSSDKSSSNKQVLSELNWKIAQHFDGIIQDDEGLLIKNGPILNLIHTASTLMKFMQDTISHPCFESFDIFKDAYFKNPPLQCAYKLLSILELDSSNPLKIAMKTNDWRKFVVFERWQQIIETVLTQFLILETYINGMYWDKNMYGPNRLKERIEKLIEQMKQWKEEV
ncbi:unnamed protein product [Caenorhabditis brenneri]